MPPKKKGKDEATEEDCSQHKTWSLKIFEVVLKHSDDKFDYSITGYLAKQRGEKFTSIHTLEGFHTAAPDKATWYKLGVDTERAKMHLVKRLRLLLLKCHTFQQLVIYYPDPTFDLKAWVQQLQDDPVERVSKLSLEEMSPLFAFKLEDAVSALCPGPDQETTSRRIKITRSISERQEQLIPGARWPAEQGLPLLNGIREVMSEALAEGLERAAQAQPGVP